METNELIYSVIGSAIATIALGYMIFRMLKAKDFDDLIEKVF